MVSATRYLISLIKCSAAFIAVNVHIPGEGRGLVLNKTIFLGHDEACDTDLLLSPFTTPNSIKKKFKNVLKHEFIKGKYFLD